MTFAILSTQGCVVMHTFEHRIRVLVALHYCHGPRRCCCCRQCRVTVWQRLLAKTESCGGRYEGSSSGWSSLIDAAAGERTCSDVPESQGVVVSQDGGADSEQAVSYQGMLYLHT